MTLSKEKAAVERILQKAGVEINGKPPWDIQVHDDRLYRRVLAQGSLGLGEAYMEKWWDCERIDLFIEKLLRSRAKDTVSWQLILLGIKARLFNVQSRGGARKVIDKHYDLGNDLYQAILDKRMIYSCAYFKEAKNLDDAQEKKLDLICRKLGLKPGQRILDIGCGWGGFMKFAAERYGVSCVGLTLSKEQYEFAVQDCAGLPIEIKLVDYRDFESTEQFDHVVSIAMAEAVGPKNFRSYFEKADALLKEGGLFLLHTIGQNITATTGNPWSDKYIFPGGMLPSIKQLGQASEGLFVMEDWHNFGPYYADTLLAWDTNFQKNWSTIQSQYSETFYRMFRYYFNSFGGAFRARHIQLWQIVFSKGANGQVYERVG